MKKQTALEWLEKKAEEREKNNPNESAYWHLKELMKDFNQAKEMEKQQIIDAHGNKQRTKSNPDSIVTYGYVYTGEMYYQDKFEKL